MKLFIDSNAWLKFYSQTSVNLRDLLDSLVDIQHDLFVPSQVVREVNRNKLNVAIHSLDSVRDKLGINDASMPVHLIDENDSKASEWNKKRLQFRNDGIKLRDEFNVIVDDLLTQIERSEDIVSKKLAKLFEGAIEESESQLERAIKRRMLGNPPGKVDDPLGDQLCWEQILDAYIKDETLIIVTEDTDYLNKNQKRLFINSSLYDELRARSDGENPNVQIFKSALEALKYYNSKSSSKIKSFPDEAVQEKIAEELKDFFDPNVFADHIWTCPVCKASGTMLEGNWIDPGGGKQVLKICPICEYTFPSGAYIHGYNIQLSKWS